MFGCWLSCLDQRASRATPIETIGLVETKICLHERDDVTRTKGHNVNMFLYFGNDCSRELYRIDCRQGGVEEPCFWIFPLQNIMLMPTMAGLAEDGKLHISQEAGVLSDWLMRHRMLCSISALGDTLPVEVWVPVEDHQG